MKVWKEKPRLHHGPATVVYPGFRTSIAYVTDMDIAIRAYAV